MSRISCDECSRADVLRAVAGQGLPAIEPGMPTPAGTGLTRRSFVARSAGLALAVYGAGKLQWFEEGIAAAASGAQKPILVTVFLQGGADALSLLYPRRRPALPEVPRRARGHGRHPVHRGRAPALESGARADRTAARRGQGVGAAVGRLRPSGPVALHLAPLLGGRRDRSAAAHRLARPLPRPRRRSRQPAAGAVDDRLAAAGARDVEGAGRRDRRA